MTKYKINKIIAAEMVERGVFLRADVSRDAAVYFESKSVIGSHLNMFLDSLDSCVLFEKSLRDDEWDFYVQECNVVSEALHIADSASHDKIIIQLTPAQRCEAFLKAIGKCW